MLIYITNYVKLSKQERVNFLKLMNNAEGFRVKDQKILFSSFGLLVELDKDSDLEKALSALKKFFSNKNLYKVELVKEIEKSGDSLLLTFDNNSQKKVRL